MENGSKRRSEGEIGVLDKVGEVISELNKSKHADQAICALHSIAVLLFPLDPSLFSGAIGERCREQVPSVEAPSADERREASCGRLFTEELHSDHLLGFC